jgi:iron complex transport system substrate-binding protein
VKPVGFGQRNQPLRPWIRAHGGDGVPTYRLVGSEKTSFERLAAWRPDLLLVQKGFASEENYPRYSAVAPTVVTSFIDWRASLRTVADALGRSDDADRLLRRTEDMTAATREKLARHAGTRLRCSRVFPGGEIYLLKRRLTAGQAGAGGGARAVPARDHEGGGGQPALVRTPRRARRRFAAGPSTSTALTGVRRRGRRKPGSAAPVVAGGRVVQLTQDESHASYFDSVLTVPLNLALLERHVGQLRR